MAYVKLTDKRIKEMCKWLEYYDNYGFLPFEKKAYTTLRGENVEYKIEKKAVKLYVGKNLVSTMSIKEAEGFCLKLLNDIDKNKR